MLPPKRERRTVFEVGGAIIKGKVAMRSKCQEIMEMAPWSGPDRAKHFRSATLIDLVSKYHYTCPRLGLQPDKFRKDSSPEGQRGYYLMGHFPGVKGDGWHGVSWNKCITHPTFQKEVSDSLRRHVRSEIIDARSLQCQLCDHSSSQLEVDHYNPTWDQIMSAIMPLFTTDEVSNWLGFDWREYEEFTLPPDHPAHTRFSQLHGQSKLTTLCQECHKHVTRQRGVQGQAHDK
jgi:hypothetical protein